MAEIDEFNEKVIAASQDKENWFNSSELPRVQEQYRLHLSCLRNLFDSLVKRGLITADPYKADKKVTEIVLPDTDFFNESDKANIIGLRLSDYESVIDYVCNYMRFSTEMLSMDKIRKLLELNNTFLWASLSSNSNKPNTKNLAILINALKSGAPQITISLVTDCVTKTQAAFEDIENVLRALAEFYREKYKIDIRNKIFRSTEFNADQAYSNSGAFVAEIKRLFPKLMGRRSFNVELVNELAEEEMGAKKEELRAKLLEKFKIVDESAVQQTVTVDTHEIILEAARLIASTGDQYGSIFAKLESNHQVLQSEQNSLKDKIARFIRKIFGLEERPTDYEVQILDKRTGTKKKELVHFNEFMQALSKRVKVYSVYAVKESPGYEKMASQTNLNILEFVNKHIVENNHLFATLTALDEFFKDSAAPANRSKIKGISMELTTIRNILVKANQARAEYAAYEEESQQMKKLGVN